MCERLTKSGKPCKLPYKYIVNGYRRKVQSLACSIHLAATVAELYAFDDERYGLRHPDDKGAGTVHLRVNQ